MSLTPQTTMAAAKNDLLRPMYSDLDVILQHSVQSWVPDPVSTNNTMNLFLLSRPAL
jgi:hypothetical protein